MNKEYLKYAVILWAVAIPCLFAGIMVKHWLFEAIAGILIIVSYLILYWTPVSENKKPEKETSSKGDKPSQ